MQNMTDAAKARVKQFKVLLNNLESHIGELREKTILDIGCGQFYPYALLFNSLGKRITVIGIDKDYIGYNTSSVNALLQELRENGLKSFIRTLLYKILLKDKAYYRALERFYGFPLNNKGLIIKRMNAENMTFPDEMFDIAISIAVFEHIFDVPKAVSELHRVLKWGGIAAITIHLFTSLSGGHHFEWDKPHKVPPWSHLRNRKPTIVYLNKLREHEYLSLFRERFEILETLDIYEETGEDLLTPEIRRELSDYSEEELLKKAITIIARK
jgi:ubiquinone/menaquinone biosynthesis C-methylase UbiE